jgi:small basic protein (TIGR04137 family)
MSIHSSLRGADSLVGERSVLTRVERIQKLLKDGKFTEENDSVYGLPKVRTKFRVVSGKKAKALEKARQEKLAEQGAKKKK